MKTAICIIIKNEQEYLKEWIDYHLNLGFTDIHIYEDKDSTSHVDIIKDYPNILLHTTEDKEINRILSIEGSDRQKYLYDYFCITYKSKYDRVAFIDIDEFITFADGYNLEMLCNEFEDDTAVLLNWKMIGASGYISKPELPTVEAYTTEGKFLPSDTGWAYKSFVNLQKYTTMKNLHFAYGAVNTDHKESILDLKYDKVWINHYFTKSWEDWCNRIFKRGGTLNGHRTLDQFFIVNPDMEPLRKTLIESISHKKPIASTWLDKENRIMVGGNLHQISKLNGKVVPNSINWPKKLSAKELKILELEVLISSKRIEISKLKEALASTDYHGHKTIDYSGTDNEYIIPQELKNLRNSQRQEINSLIEQLEQLELQLEELKQPEIESEIKEITEK